MFFTTNKIVIMLFTGQARFILTLYHVCFFLYFNIHSFSTNRGFRANVMRIGNSYLDSVHLKNPRLVRNECSVCCIWYVKYGLSHSVCNIRFVTYAMQLLSCRCLLGSSFYRITIDFEPFERKHILFEASFTELSPCWKRDSWIICWPGNGFFDGWINAIYKYGWLKKLITVYSNSKNVAQSKKNSCTKWTVLISALSYYLNAYFLENCESRFCIEKLL